MAKCTILPPTALPLLFDPSFSGYSPSQIRSSVQYSFCWWSSSEANSSSGRHHGPASSATTEKPYSASLQASVPPPAPVPTMAKSTASSSVYSRMATQAPGLKTSGARPLMALGEVSSDMFVLPARFVFPAGRCLGGLPGVAAIEIHPHIAARACRSAEADLIPGRRMRVIGGGNVMQQPLPEEDCRRHALPGVRR